MQQDIAGQVQVSPKLISLADLLRERAEKLELLVARLDGLRNRLTGVGMEPGEQLAKEPPPSGIVGGLVSIVDGISTSLDRFDEVMNSLEGIG